MKFTGSLKKTSDFKAVYDENRSKADRYLVLFVKENGTDSNRLGISISKKVGNSVVRHHFCRLVREAYRLHEEMFNSGLDIVIMARKPARDAGYHQISHSILFLANLQKILK